MCFKKLLSALLNLSSLYEYLSLSDYIKSSEKVQISTVTFNRVFIIFKFHFLFTYFLASPIMNREMEVDGAKKRQCVLVILARSREGTKTLC